MIGAPNTRNVCQAVLFDPVSAITGATIERPTKMPATKLPASRNLLKTFFIAHSNPDYLRRRNQDSRCAGSLTEK
jgi:hypothetical protein